MDNKGRKIFVAVMSVAVVVVVVLFYLPTDSLTNYVLEPYTEVNWDEVIPRNIVKLSSSIALLEDFGEKCKVSAPAFDIIISHKYFVKGKELALKLDYDSEKETLMLPCDLLAGEKSRLNVWYVVEESPTHSKKYQYFVTPWVETPRD